ncbi:hypothetical protein Hanom_Chr08g00695031 [Helianthus anomalus]
MHFQADSLNFLIFLILSSVSTSSFCCPLSNINHLPTRCNTNLSRKKRTVGKKTANIGRATKSPYVGNDSCSKSIEFRVSTRPISKQTTV